MNGPVVIGGIGGSGTRVIAELLLEVGFYLGCDFNRPMDNLGFTLLFKRPKWREEARREPERMREAMRVFTNSMAGEPVRSVRDVAMISRAALDNIVMGQASGSQRCVWPVARAWRLMRPRRPGASGSLAGWGWKEPNSHLYLEELIGHFGDMKYIHTVRHGLDMAFSKNQQQLNNWGRLFGVEPARRPEEMPRASLKYWVRANQKVLKLGERLGKERMLWLNFDRLCHSPRPEIEKLLGFLGVAAEEAKLGKLSEIPRVPSSQGRYRKQDLKQFDPEDLDAVQKLGFDI